MNGSASNVSDQFIEFEATVLRALPRDLDQGVMQGWIENGGALADVLREALAPKGRAPMNTFRLVVNYDVSVEDLVRAGKYDWADEAITSENSPTERKGKMEVEFTLVHFNRAISTKDALAELKEHKLRPAETKELLAFGAKHPGLQRRFLIIELGSVWQDPNGQRSCAYLWSDGSKRSLNLGWLKHGWSEDYRFLAVRES